MRRLLIIAFIAVAVAAIGSQFLPQPAPARSLTHWFPPAEQLGALANYPQYALCDPASGNCASISSNGQIATTGGGGGGGSSTVYNGTGSQTLVASSFLGDGGTYNSAAQTCVAGQYCPFQTDVNGYLDVDVKVGGGGGSGSTPIPFATNANGQLVVAEASPFPTTLTVNTAAPYVAPTCAAAPNAPCVQITGPVVVNTAAPVTSVTANAGTGTFNVALGATPQPVSGTVAVTGAPTPIAYTSAAPIPATIVNQPATYVLGASSATIGSIANTAFGITGSLPAGSNNIGSVTDVFPYSLATGGQTGTASSGIGVLGQYNSTALTLTSGQVAPLQLDANGYLAVDVKVGGGGGGSTTLAYSTVPFPTATQTPAPNTALGISCPVATPTSAPTGGVIPITCSPTNGGINLGSITAAVSQPYSMVTQGQTALASSGVGVLGVYNSTAPTLTTGQAAPLQQNASGALITAQSNAIQPYNATSNQTQQTASFVGIAGYASGSTVNAAYVDSSGIQRHATCNQATSNCQGVSGVGTAYVTNGGSTYATLSATGSVKASAGRLERIQIATAPTVSGTVTCYDNTAASGTPIAVITTGTTAGVLFPTTGTYDWPANTGIYCSYGATGGSIIVAYF